LAEKLTTTLYERLHHAMQCKHSYSVCLYIMLINKFFHRTLAHCSSLITLIQKNPTSSLKISNQQMHTLITVVTAQTRMAHALRRSSRVHASYASAVAWTLFTPLGSAAVLHSTVQSCRTNVKIVQLQRNASTLNEEY